MTSETNNGRPRSAFSPARGMLNAGIAALAFLLTCAGLTALLPVPELNIVTSRLRFFEEHRDDFDTLFIGSSRIRHQISPAIFDRKMSEAGFPTRSFNFGINAMVPPETGYFLERLLRTKPRHLKWVFIELDEVQVRRVPETETTQRAVYWHDWKRTALLLRAIVEAGPEQGGFALFRKAGQLLLAGPGKAETRDLLVFHGTLFAKNFANVGRKTELTRWFSNLGNKAKPFADKVGPAGDGYIPLDRVMPPEEATAYEAELQNAVNAAGARHVSPATEVAYRQLADEVRKAGATPIFIVAPVMMQIELSFRPESGLASRIMAFNDAGAYPQLYRREMRIDSGHLNGVAAEELTRLVAENFSQLRRENRIE